MKNYSVGGLFSGVGGIELGFEKAGFNVTFGIDNDESAAKTFEFNHSTSKFLARLRWVSQE